VFPEVANAGMKFLVDSTAGKLCRWLRVLGHDADYVSSAAPGEMLGRARREGRRLLTRNRSLGERDPRVATTIESDHLADQLRQLGRTYPILDEAAPFTRCLVCNGRFESVSRARARNRVPPYVYQTQKAFGYCPRCDRFYWQATHWEAMRARLEHIFGPGVPRGRSPEAPGG